MSYNNGAKIITSGLAMLVDVANVKCFKGEPTTNLSTFHAYDNWSSDHQANITQTSDSNVVYSENATRRIVSTGNWNIYRNGAVYFGNTIGTIFTVSWKMKRADNAGDALCNDQGTQGGVIGSRGIMS